MRQRNDIENSMIYYSRSRVLIGIQCKMKPDTQSSESSKLGGTGSV